MSALDSKAGFWLARFLACALFLRFTFDAPPAGFVEVSMAAGHVSYM